MSRTQADMRKRLGLTAPVYKQLVKTVQNSLNAEANKAGSRRDPLGRVVFSYPNEFNFDDAFQICFKTLRSANVTEPLFSCMNDKPVRLSKSKQTGRISFEEITARSTWSELNKRITFVRTGEKGDGVRSQVPIEVANYVWEQAYDHLPQAPEIIYTPVYTSDGSLIFEPGWYPELDLLMADTGFEVEPPPVEPTAADVERAVRWLKEELLGDFPFYDRTLEGEKRREPSEANALAMLITPFMRRMINGCTPVFFVAKPMPATGGTLLGKLPMFLFDGAESAPMRYSQSEEEMQKSLLSSIIETRSHLFFDDVREFNNRALLQSITSEHIGGRLLGATKNVERPNRFNWVGTGNNPLTGPEMERRICWINLNAETDKMQERVFRHKNYTDWLKTNRAVAVNAILTLIQHWIACGKPKFSERKLVSFEDWAAKVGGVLQCAAITGFLDNRRDGGTDMDESAIRQFVKEWLRKYGVGKTVLPSELFNHATDMALDVLEGNNDDQKKSRFQKRLISLDGRTFRFDDIPYMVCRTLDEERNPAYVIRRLDAEGAKKAA
jgi:hypothetical protein